MNYKEFFKDKKISVIGIGPHGEMVADIKFLSKLSRQVSLYDIRSEARLQGFMQVIMGCGLAGCSLGRVAQDELAKADLIILSPEISRKALFLKKAHEAGVRIEYPGILFMKLAPPITLIGIMGACGKSTVANMLYGILKKSFAGYEDQGLYFIDPDLPNGAMTHLKKVKSGDIVLARIPEDMMGECYAARISPHVAVFTSLVSSNILEYQTYNNFVVAPDNVIETIRSQPGFASKAKMLRTKAGNSSLAIQVSELFKVSQEDAQDIVSGFSGLKGRQELVKKVGGVEFYNDSASVNPISTLAAIKAFSINKNIILIFGGAYTPYDYGELIRSIPEYASIVILLPGSGTLGFRSEVEKLKGIKFFQVQNMEEAVLVAREYGKKGDRVLFSPGCEAIGVHISRKERGEKFVKAVRAL
ncbi:MAG: cyanophycin synthetase [bacterium]|nr:cyanophycin synthetase [bacterium]